MAYSQHYLFLAGTGEINVVEYHEYYDHLTGGSQGERSVLQVHATSSSKNVSMGQLLNQ